MRVPQIVILLSVLAVSLSFVPHALWIKSRFAKSELPRVHPVMDMDDQPKYKPQKVSLLFADGQTFRQPIPGTVARGELHEEEGYWRGMEHGDYVKVFPAEVTVNAELLKRGQNRYEIYCTPCHGKLGDGDGVIGQRAAKARQAWTKPSNLNDELIVARPHGYLFNVITNGVRNMQGYAGQISVPDRWAIVAYVRALQRAGNGKVEDLPAGAERDKISAELNK